jgi:LysM repeat protein
MASEISQPFLSKNKILICFICGNILPGSPPAIPVHSDAPSADPIYTVQGSDTLWSLSQQFSITLSDLEAVNLSYSTIYVGWQLTIPGLQGVTGTLAMEPFNLGTPSVAWRASISSPFGIRRSYIGIGTDLKLETYDTGIDYVFPH